MRIAWRPRLVVPAGLLLAGLTAAAVAPGRAGQVGDPETRRYAASGLAVAQRESTLTTLRAWETDARRAADFESPLTTDPALDPDPFRVAALPGGANSVLLMRGASELVVLGSDLNPRQRLPAPASPTGLAVGDDHVVVGGELAPVLTIYRILADGTLEFGTPIPVPGLSGVRDLTMGPGGMLYLVDDVSNRMAALRLVRGATGWETERLRWIDIGQGPVQVRALGGLVLVNTLRDARITVYPTNAQGFPNPDAATFLEHDGPMWSFDCVLREGSLVLAAGGVEDHPLDRTGGFFGYVDSYLYTYRVGLTGEGRSVRPRKPVRLAAVNVGRHGVVTPKCVRIEEAADSLRVTVYGYGGWSAVEATWGEDRTAEPGILAGPMPAGITDVADLGDGRRLAADPLLDGFLVLDESGLRGNPPGDVVPCASRTKDPEALLGELLFFTGLMGPAQTSEGPQSRFTCETCHFEGYGDGRVHFTGRGKVFATTKPLRGLFNNKPHFSRALDDDLTEMVDHEFRVACAETGLDPWFTLYPAEYPGLGPALEEPIPPQTQRGALMRYLMRFTFAPNPLALAETRWSAQEARGAAVFRQRCEGCHQARIVADDPATRLGASDWERLVLSAAGPIVWATGEYRKTGVEPYVHDRGARVPSLRRLYKKHPYFTNGSASSLTEVLRRVRFSEAAFYHDGAPVDPGLQALTDWEQRSLAAFLRLL